MPIQIGEYEKFVKFALIRRFKKQSTFKNQFALIRRLKTKTICKLN